MSDQISDQFSADKVRSILDNRAMRDEEKIAGIKAMLLAPKRPTLAEMSIEDRETCRWMRADVAGTSTRYMIADPRDEDNDAAILFSEDGQPEWVFPEYVTPRPDLPRLTWTDTVKAAPGLPGEWRLADHEVHGRVIVTDPAPDAGGYIYFVRHDDEFLMGFDWDACRPDELTYIDTEPEEA